MRKHLILLFTMVLIFSLSACRNKQPPDVVIEGPSVATTPTPIAVTAEGLAWRESIVKSPLIAEVEYKGTRYEVHVSDSLKYIYNTSTHEIITGTSTGDAKAAVLKDWIAPYGQTPLEPSEALFETTWEYTSSRIRGLIGYCDTTYTLVTRARTADYLEYLYEDTTNKKMYRIAVTDDYILFAPLMFTYVFDANAY